MPYYYVCSYLLNHTSVNVGQEDRPRRYCSQGYQHQWCHINTWLPTGRYHCCCSHHSFFFLSHADIHTDKHAHTHTHTEACLVYGLSYADVILETFSTAYLSRLRRWKPRKLVQNFNSCPQAGRLDSRITCRMMHSYLHIFCSPAENSNGSSLQPWYPNSWWTLSDSRVELRTVLLTSDALQNTGLHTLWR